MKRRLSEDCLSDLQLDRWLARELSQREQPKLEVHVARCSSCRERRAELEEEHRLFGQSAPEPAASSQLRAMEPSHEVAALRTLGRGVWLAGAGVLAAAAALALLVTGTEQSLSPGEDHLSKGTRTKGGVASLGWIVRRGSEVFAGHPDQPLRSGDALRFTVSAREPVHVAVLGLDAAGQLSVYHPEGDRLSKVEVGQEQALPGAIELDAMPGEEQLYGVFCKTDVPLAAIRAALERSSAAPLLPNGCDHERWSLKKEQP